MILIGAFGLFWFGRSRSSLSVSLVPCHSACLPRTGRVLLVALRNRRPGAKPAGLSSNLPVGADRG